MKLLRILLAILLVFNSCSSNSNVPPRIIKPAQMQQIIWDIVRGDILAQQIVDKDSTKNIKDESLAISEKIFLIHHVSRDKFDESISFYSKHPQLLKTILDSLSTQQLRKISRQKMGAGNQSGVDKRKILKQSPDLPTNTIKTK